MLAAPRPPPSPRVEDDAASIATSQDSEGSLRDFIAGEDSDDAEEDEDEDASGDESEAGSEGRAPSANAAGAPPGSSRRRRVVAADADDY